MAGKGGKDPMAGLLSGVSGLDGSLFARPSSMNDMRTKGPQQSPLNAKVQPGIAGSGLTGPESSPTVVTPPNSYAGRAQVRSMGQYPAGTPPQTGFKGVAGSGTSTLDPFSLDTLGSNALGDSKRMSQQNHGGSPVQPGYNFAPKSSPPQNLNLSGIEDILGPGVSAKPVHSRLEFAAGKDKCTPDPLGNLVQTTSAIAHDDPFGVLLTPPKPQVRVSPTNTGQDDLLGGFEGSLGVVDHSDTSFNSNRHSMRADPGFGSNSNLSVGEDEWGSLASVSSTPSTPASPIRAQKSAGLSGSPEGLRQEVKPPVHRSEAPAPPSYTEAVSDPHPRAASAKNLAPTRRDSDEEGDAGPSNLWEIESEGGHVPANTRTSRPQPGSGRRGPTSNVDSLTEGAKEQARVWLQTGQTWLKSATAKVSKATKEAGVALQKGFEDLDSRLAQKGASTSSSRTSGRSSDDPDMPKFYYDWATKISQLSPERQANTLAQLPEDDRLFVQRILDRATLSESTLRQQQGGKSPIEGTRASRLPTRGNLETDSKDLWDTDTRTEACAPGRTSRPPRQAPPPSQPTSRTPIATGPAAEGDLLGFGTQNGRPAPSRESADLRQPTKASDPRRPAMQEQADFLGFDKGAGVGPGTAKQSVASGPKKTVEKEAQRPTAAPAASVGLEGDLLGLHSSGISGSPSQPPRGPAAAPPASVGLEEDLLGLHSSGTSQPSRTAPSAAEDIDILHAFAQASPSVPVASPVGKSGIHNDLEEMFGAGRPAPSRPPGDSMIDFGDDDDVPAEHGHLYEDAQAGADGDEPEVRRLLRERRIAEKHMRMRQKLAEKQARDEAEFTEKAAKVEFREQYKAKIEAWQSGKKDNIRALLSTLHTVLWEGSGWTAPGLTDLVEANKVKRWYMKANLVVHPDKVKQKGGTVEQIVIADMAFDALKVAWGKFESELRG